MRKFGRRELPHLFLNGTMKKIRFILHLIVAGVLGGMLVSSTASAQQAKWRMPLTMTDSTYDTTSHSPVLHSTVAYFGVHPNATNCADAFEMTGFNDHWADIFILGLPYTDSMQEIELPPPGQSIDLRLESVFPLSCRVPLYANVQTFTSTSQVDSFIVIPQPFDGQSPHPTIYTIPSVSGEYCDSVVITGSKTDPDAGQTFKYDFNLTKNGGRFADIPTQPDQILLTTFKLYVYHPVVGPGAPATVSLLSPPNGDTNDSLQLTLKWAAPALADYYRVQMSTDPSFADTTQTFVNQVTNTNSFFTPALGQGMKYYWRVEVYNKYGISYYQDPAFGFTTKVLTPDAPVTLLPTAGQQNVPLTPTFRWKTPNSTQPVTSYHFQVSITNTFSSNIKDTTLIDTTYVFGPLQNCLMYFWRVQATSSAGTGSYSTVQTFRTLLATPNIPALSAPANGSSGISPSPTLTWTSADPCSDNYRVQVTKDTTAAVSSYAANSSTVQKSLAVGPLEQDVTYYWRVDAYNALDSSAYTAWFNFHTQLLPPAAPVLIFPAVNDTSVQASDTFVWHASPYAALYHLQIANDVNFTSLVLDDSTATDTTYAVTILKNCAMYYYRVAGKNASGTGSYAAARQFKTRTAVPSAPLLVSPTNNQDSVAQRPTLTWSAGDLCLGSYTLFISHFNDFSDTVYTTTTNQVSVTLPTILPGKTDFYWRVRSFNGVGTGPFSATYHFKTTPFTPPDVPVLVSPIDGANDQPLTITFVWDTSARAVTYRLQVAVDAGFTLLVFNDSTIAQTDSATVSRTVSGLLNSTKYYWRVNGKNGAGTGAFATARSLNTLAPPPAPILLSPTNGETNVSVLGVFSWALADRATYYELEIGNDTAFASVFYDDSLLTNASWRIPSGLNQITKYFWRVRAKNSAGTGPWSAVFSFMTQHTGFADWAVAFHVAETGPAADVVYFGLNPVATAGIDPGFGEYELPPVTPGWFDVRFISPLIGQGLLVDIQKFSSYTQQDTFQVSFQPGIGTYPMKFWWSASMIKSVCDSMILVDKLTGGSMRVRMDTDSSASVSDVSITSLYIVEFAAYQNPNGVSPAKRPLPKGFMLSQNYPNPFNPTTRIDFSTDKAADLRLAIYNVLGQEVASLANGSYLPGAYSLTWNGKDEHDALVPSGVYLVRMIALDHSGDPASANPVILTRKILLMK